MCGTIANKPKTLKKLLSTIHSSLVNVSNDSSIVPPIIYNNDVENYINNLENDIKKILPDNKKYLSRWISLKLLDENTSINDALKSNLNIDIENYSIIQEKLLEIKSDLDTKRINFFIFA